MYIYFFKPDAIQITALQLPQHRDERRVHCDVITVTHEQFSADGQHHEGSPSRHADPRGCQVLKLGCHGVHEHVGVQADVKVPVVHYLNKLN